MVANYKITKNKNIRKETRAIYTYKWKSKIEIKNHKSLKFLYVKIFCHK